jgi:hypothetical protein
MHGQVGLDDRLETPEHHHNGHSVTGDSGMGLRAAEIKGHVTHGLSNIFLSENLSHSALLTVPVEILNMPWK